uniref:Asialoglycoprotein receptor 1 n=1 Tax=Suricata suricatta TaxID=37032 RepID=A0A673TUN4_SURSU
MPCLLTAPPPPQRLLRRLCSGPCFLLLSLGLGLLLLVVVCVIGSQNSKLRDELQALSVTFSNFTASTEVEVKALSSQGGNVGRKMKSLESQLEKQQQELSEDHSSLLLHVKQFVSDLRSLSCQIAVLHGNGSAATCCPVNWVEYEGSCYWFSRSGKSWPEANKYCQLENAHLVVVGSWEEQKFVQHHMGPVNTWMGLTDQSGPWKWVDGTDYEKGFKRPGSCPARSPRPRRRGDTGCEGTNGRHPAQKEPGSKKKKKKKKKEKRKRKREIERERKKPISEGAKDTQGQRRCSWV